MKNILILISLFSVSFGVLSAHHEKDESSKVMQGNNFAYLSSYTIAAGEVAPLFQTTNPNL